MVQPQVSAPVGEVSQPNNTSCQGDQAQCLLTLSSVFWFPANQWNRLNKPITSPHGSQGAPRPLDPVKAPPSGVGSSLPLSTPPVTPHAMRCRLRP